MLVEAPAAPPHHQRHPHLSGGEPHEQIEDSVAAPLTAEPSPPRTPSLNLGRHKDASPPDVTYSRFVNGSILSCPKPEVSVSVSASAASGAPVAKMGGGISPGDSLVASVYGFVKYFLR